MTGDIAARRLSLDSQTLALLRAYDVMRNEWADRFEAGGMAASRDFADAVFARFRCPERDVVPARSIDLTVSGGDGERPARLYLPEAASEGAPFPQALFLHGGGWSLGGIEAYDGLVGSLAALSGTAILSLEYRLAPEYPFPAGLDDARAGLDWLHRSGAKFGGDPDRIAVIGDSAGGNLAAVLAREAALGGGVQPACQILIYPMTDVARPHSEFPSRGLFGDGSFFLVEAAIEIARDGYLEGTDASADDPRVSPLLASVPGGLAPALILTAGHDPLRDEAAAYHEMLGAAGTQSTYHCFAETIHAFASFGVLDQAQAARRMIAEYLQRHMRCPAP